MATRGRRMVEMALEKNKSVQVSKESKISENVSLDKNAVSSSGLDELNAPHNVSDLLLDISGISELDLSVSNFPDCLDSSLSIVPVEPQKEATREILAKWRSEAKINKDVHVKIFDLEKVLYVPKCNRGEIFYKRRLACLNFTVFDVGSSQGHCYFWNESLAGRCANEIASCLHQYAQLVDNTTSATSLVLFSDGCSGQNKNSILPTMFRQFLLTSKTLQSVRLHYFETNHGQSEGDCIHSVNERAVNKIEDIAVPSELVGIIKAAAKTKPYVVNEITTEDVFDYKTAATASGILRVRSSDIGNPVSWPAFMQMEVSKDKPGKISFKTSHVQAAFEEITLPARRSGEAPVRCIETAPKLSAGKYKDLADLCSGPKPVISNPDQRKFYLSLPHS